MCLHGVKHLFCTKYCSRCTHLINLKTEMLPGILWRHWFFFCCCCFLFASTSFSWSLDHFSPVLFLSGWEIIFQTAIVKPYCLIPGSFCGLLCSNIIFIYHRLSIVYCTELSYSWHLELLHCRKPGQLGSPCPWVPDPDSHCREAGFYYTVFLCKTNFWPSLLVGKWKAHSKVGAGCEPSSGSRAP